MRTDTPQTIRLKDYCPPAYLIDKVDLDIALDPSRTRVRSKLKIRRNPASTENGGPLRLNGENLELATILLDKAELQSKDYEITETELVIRKPPEKPFTLRSRRSSTQGRTRRCRALPVARHLLHAVRGPGLPPHHLFLDRPDVLSRYTVRIEADRERGAGAAVATAIPVERGTLDGGKRHYAVWRDPHPKPCYLFALVGGDLSPIASTFTTRRAARWICASTSSPARRRAAPGRWIR